MRLVILICAFVIAFMGTATAQTPNTKPITSDVFCPLVGQIAQAVMKNHQSGMTAEEQLRLINKHFPRGEPFRATVLILYSEASRIPTYDREEDKVSAALLFATRAESDCFLAFNDSKAIDSYLEAKIR